MLKTSPNSPTQEILDVDSKAITEELIEVVCTVANSADESINVLRMVSSYGGSLSARKNSHHLTENQQTASRTSQMTSVIKSTYLMVLQISRFRPPPKQV